MIHKDILFYEKEIDLIKLELRKLPDGHLYKKGPYYFQTINTIQKGITKDRQKIMHLARKAYLLRRLKHLEWNLSLAKKYAAKCKVEDLAYIILELPPYYQTLPINYFYHYSIQERFEKTPKGIIGFENELIYLTNSGIRVRSKSERIIADALDQNVVPYHYEAALKLGGGTICPDFVIYRPFDGKMIIWEHFGLMDDRRYRQKTNGKIAAYARYEFYPFDNLICTYEKDIINPAYIQTIIEMFLLQ